nr:hypothetical protein [Allomuricauda sp.]
MIAHRILNKCILLFLFPLFVAAQEESKASQELFVALYTTGSSWDKEKSPGQQSYFKEHSAFLSGLRKDSVIVLGARYSDTGMLVLKAQSLQAATDLLQSDIAVKEKLFNVEVHTFNPFYKGCLD